MKYFEQVPCFESKNVWVYTPIAGFGSSDHKIRTGVSLTYSICTIWANISYNFYENIFLKFNRIDFFRVVWIFYSKYGNIWRKFIEISLLKYCFPFRCTPSTNKCMKYTLKSTTKPGRIPASGEFEFIHKLARMAVPVSDRKLPKHAAYSFLSLASRTYRHSKRNSHRNDMPKVNNVFTYLVKVPIICESRPRVQ